MINLEWKEQEESNGNMKKKKGKISSETKKTKAPDKPSIQYNPTEITNKQKNSVELDYIPMVHDKLNILLPNNEIETQRKLLELFGNFKQSRDEIIMQGKRGKGPIAPVESRRQQIEREKNQQKTSKWKY